MFMPGPPCSLCGHDLWMDDDLDSRPLLCRPCTDGIAVALEGKLLRAAHEQHTITKGCRLGPIQVTGRTSRAISCATCDVTLSVEREPE